MLDQNEDIGRHAEEEYSFWDSGISPRPPIALVLRGGGTRGLIFPGQIAGLEDIMPARLVALAGSSAGALIAAAMWAGHSPISIRDKMLADVGDRSLFSVMFSGQDRSQYMARLGFVPFAWAYNRTVKRVGDFFGKALGGKSVPTAEFLLGADGETFERYSREFILAGFRRRGITDRLIEWHTGEPISNFNPNFGDIKRILQVLRFVNTIGSKDEFFDAPGLAEQFEDVDFLLSRVRFTPESTVKRNNIFETYFDEPIAKDPWFPPIFLSICDVINQDIVLFNNLEPRYEDVPIASAVRASAGHPFVFARRQLFFADGEAECVDGGVLLNYPAAAIGRRLRKLLSNCALDEWTKKEYASIQAKPLIIVGLATEDERPKKVSHLNSLWSMYTGGAQSRLEFEIAKELPHFASITQSTSGLPRSLNFCAASREYINGQFESGRKFIRENVRIVDEQASCSNQTRTCVERAMRSMIDAIVRASGGFPDNLGPIEYVRAHLFLETTHENHVLMGKKAAITKGRPGSEFRDFKHSVLKPGAGVTGECFKCGSVVFGKIDRLQERRSRFPDQHCLGLRWSDVELLPNDLNFCFTIPVYDSRSFSYRPVDLLAQQGPKLEEDIAVFPCAVKAPVAGVISVDGRLPRFDAELEQIVADVEAQELIPILERFAFDVAAVLTRDLSQMLYTPGANLLHDNEGSLGGE